MGVWLCWRNHYFRFAFVLWCMYRLASFQYFLLCHLVISPIRNTEKLPKLVCCVSAPRQRKKRETENDTAIICHRLNWMCQVKDYRKNFVESSLILNINAFTYEGLMLNFAAKDLKLIRWKLPLYRFYDFYKKRHFNNKREYHMRYNCKFLVKLSNKQKKNIVYNHNSVFIIKQKFNFLFDLKL